MIYLADSTWLPTQCNPFKVDGTYGDDWSSFIYDLDTPYFTNVYPNAKLHTLRFSPKIDKDHYRLFDFLQYETTYKRNVIFKVSKGMNGESLVERFKTLPSKVERRNSDVNYMVHSTTLASWKMIQAEGALLSPNALKKKGIQINEIGLKPMLEPKDYSDYIMLDVLNGCGELVVNSRNLGSVCIDPNVIYQPGVRIYFDVAKMFDDEIVTRDGLHLIKIKDRLPLERYMLALITPSDFDATIKWTPTLFTEQANKLFLECYMSPKIAKK